MAIALKEENETEYWLSILKDVSYIDDRMFKSLNKDCVELIKLLTSIIKTAKSNSK
jgi:four helix bundle protein